MQRTLLRGFQMEKYSKATSDFFQAIKEEADSLARDPNATKIIRAAKLIKNPQNVSGAIAVQELAKQGSQEIPDDISPVKLKNILVDNYQVHWLDWLPEVTDKTVFDGEISEVLSNKVQAIRVCLTTDTPWLEWHIFENVGTAFNHQVPDFNRMQPLTLGECITTMDTMKKLRPEENFSEEVLSYIASIAANENYVYLPRELHVGEAQLILDKMLAGFHEPDFVKMVDYQWNRLKDKDLLDAKFEEDSSIHRQLANLAIAQQYYREFLDDN